MRPIEIHSYRTVFQLDRRIYRVDRLRLNPGGVPLRALLYCAALCASSVVMARLPLIGMLLGIVPWSVRDLLAPIVLAWLLTMIRVDGRPSHLAARTLLRYAFASHQLTALDRRSRIGQAWRPTSIVVLPDGSDGRLRRLRCQGPGKVRVAPAHEWTERELGPLARLLRRPELTLMELTHHRAPAQAVPIVLAQGASLRVR